MLTTGLSGLAGFLEEERTKLILRLSQAESNLPLWLLTVVRGSFDVLKDLKVDEAEVSELFGEFIEALKARSEAKQ